MATPDQELQRLLESAARAPTEPLPEMPFGFETRVVALAREQRATDQRDGRVVTRLFRRVALTALIVTAVSAGAAYWQVTENDDLAEPLTNAYAIADTAIDAEFFQ